MPSTSNVSVVIPVFNDEETLATALDSCLTQTTSPLEVICVDDGSTDGSVGLVEQYAARDARVRLLKHKHNRSAYQARRTGVMAATGDRILFVDGDDELLPGAIRKLCKISERHDFDLIGFAVEVMDPRGHVVGGYQKRLAPAHGRLAGDAVLEGLFPTGQPVQGQLWRYLFRASLLRDAYNRLPTDLVLPRVNDLPLLYVVASITTTYVSTPDRLYRYRYGRGGSGQPVENMEQARFYADAIRSIDSIAPTIRSISRTQAYPGMLLDNYESVRLSVIGYVCAYLLQHARPDLRQDVLDHLYTRASATDLLIAATRFSPDSLSSLKAHSAPVTPPGRSRRNVMLTTRTIANGGVSGVVLTQAKYLAQAGYAVTIVARRLGSIRATLPDGVTFIEMVGKGLPERLVEWTEICRIHEIDVIIDHQILYSRDWPEYALAARASGVATIGWIHSFAARPLYDLNGLHDLLKKNANLLEKIVTLSRLDVAFWKLRGASHTVYVPNPPSPLLLETAVATKPKEISNGALELVWWGRLDEHTKQVSHLIEVSAHLRKMRVNFRFTIIGPDSGTWTQSHFNAVVLERGLQSNVRAVGELRGKRLIEAIDAAHVFVSTSIIEGYQLTIPEAQARGLPVFMYELPWLAVVQGNDGVVASPQGDAAALAAQIATLAESPTRYAQLSAASIDAAHRAMSYDFGKLYAQVVTDDVPDEFSPEPSLQDAQELIDLLIFYTEQNAGAKKATAAGRRVAMRPAHGSLLADVRQRLWNIAKPVGRTALQMFPRLQPWADQIKHRLLRAQ